MEHFSSLLSYILPNNGTKIIVIIVLIKNITLNDTNNINNNGLD